MTLVFMDMEIKRLWKSRELICVKVGPKPHPIVATSGTFHLSKNS